MVRSCFQGLLSNDLSFLEHSKVSNDVDSIKSPGLLSFNINLVSQVVLYNINEQTKQKDW